MKANMSCVAAKIHWHDSCSGDGMAKLEDGRLVYFYCTTVADLCNGETVYGRLIEDTTFTQFVLSLNKT